MSRYQIFRAAIADLHRPAVILMGGISASVAALISAAKGVDLLGAAALQGAIWTGVAVMYWGRSWENTRSPQAPAPDPSREPPVGGGL